MEGSMSIFNSNPTDSGNMGNHFPFDDDLPGECKSFNTVLQLLRALSTVFDDIEKRRVDWGFPEPLRGDKQYRACSILAALPDALDADDQLTLCYQPRVDLTSGRLVSVEALLRWKHPTLGQISPTEFIPLMEKAAVIGAVTDWVITHVLRQTRLWQIEGHTFKVSINVSACDIERGNFFSDISTRLVEHNLPPSIVEFELTENALIHDSGKVYDEMSKLRNLGIDVSIDDFGTGYCNMCYLKSVPASIIKIDQSFIRKLSADNKDQFIVHSMIDLAHGLGYRVVAEGIETQDSYTMLQQWGCDEGQGYLMAKPMDAAALMQWINCTVSSAKMVHRSS
jgi:EAL domain-containing protein (putative c-di-GMP-specific phosphodiesterase class I)